MNDFSNEPIQPSDSSSSTGGESKPTWLTRKEYTDPAEKKRDFWIGVGFYFILNIVMSLCLWAMGYGFVYASPDFWTTSDTSPMFSLLLWVITLLPWIVNIGFVIYFALTRSQIALGMVAGFGIALAIAICLGVIFMIACFVALGTLGG
jgi:hypothetical protein